MREQFQRVLKSNRYCLLIMMMMWLGSRRVLMLREHSSKSVIVVELSLVMLWMKNVYTSSNYSNAQTDVSCWSIKINFFSFFRLRASRILIFETCDGVNYFHFTCVCTWESTSVLLFFDMPLMTAAHILSSSMIGSECDPSFLIMIHKSRLASWYRLFLVTFTPRMYRRRIVINWMPSIWIISIFQMKSFQTKHFFG